MKLVNLTPGDKILGFIGTHGSVLEDSGALVISDSYSSHPSLSKMENAGLISITDFTVNDAPTANVYKKNPGDYISAAEYNATVKGLYVIPNTWNSVGIPTATATPAISTGTVVGPFNTSSSNILKFEFDGLNTVSVEFPSGQLSILSAVSALTANLEFSKYGTAADDGLGKLQITSKALGTNSAIMILDAPRSAAAQFGMDNPVEIAGTGVASVVTIETHNTVGNGILGIEHAIKLWDSLSAGAISTAFIIQRITKGVIKSGLTTAEAIIESGENGEVKFEVAAPGALALCYADVMIPSTYYFAQKPIIRLQVN